MTDSQQWGGVRVPWISPWSSERRPPSNIVLRRGWKGTGIGFADEDGHVDRRNDVLWIRMAATPGVGRPNFASVHPLRQRQAMSRLLCQVCGRSTIASRDDERHLFLIHSTGTPIREGERTTAPPVHEACAREAIRDCPHLRKGWAAALVEYPPAWGVAGILYDPDTLEPVFPALEGEPLDYVSYHDAQRLRWILAAREVVTLHGVEEVDVASLSSATGARRSCR